MMGVQATSARLFYDFRLDDHVPSEHMLRSVDAHLNLDDVRQALKPFVSIGFDARARSRMTRSIHRREPARSVLDDGEHGAMLTMARALRA